MEIFIKKYLLVEIVQSCMQLARNNTGKIKDSYRTSWGVRTQDGCGEETFFLRISGGSITFCPLVGGFIYSDGQIK